MYTKIIFLIVTLYVVNASVISQDTYDDIDGEISELTSDLTDLADRRRCSNRLCNVLCRKRYFRSGTCVNSRCRCRNTVYRSFADDVPENSVEASGPNVDEVESKAFHNVVEDSEPKLNEIDVEDTDSEIDEKRRCFSRICTILCRLKRFNNGTCVNNRCRCWNNARRLFADEILDDLVEECSLNEYEVNDVAFNTEAEESDVNLTQEAKDTEVEIAELFSDLAEKRRCSPRPCNRICRLKRRGNGNCVNGRCKCSNEGGRLFADEILDDISEESGLNAEENKGFEMEMDKKRRCIPRICSILCRLKRYNNGTCVNNRCRCWNNAGRSFTDEKIDDIIEEPGLNVYEVKSVSFNKRAEESDLNLNEEVKDTEASIAELSSDPIDLGERRRCFNRVCNLICRFKRLGNGTCIEGQCRCSNKEINP